MNLKRIICGGIAALTIIATCFTCFAASGASYTETSYALPKAEHIYGIYGLRAHDDGNIDYFVLRSDAGWRNPTHFHSQDGGATWKQMDMGWYKELLTKYPEAETSRDFYMTENGDIYFTLITGQGKESQNGKDNNLFSIFSVFKYSGGRTEEIQELQMGYFGGVDLDIVGVDKSGNIALVQYSAQRSGKPNSIRYYDAKTKQASKAFTVPYEWNPQVYANNAVFGTQTIDKKFMLVAYDIKTGKQTLALPVPGDAGKNYSTASLGADENGTVYLTSSTGLYCVKPGGSELTKLMDSASTYLAQKVDAARAAACTPSGKVYVPIRNDDTRALKAKLYCYSPK